MSIGQTEPILPVHDMSLVRSFYEKLGFKAWHNSPHYDILTLDGLVVHLEHHADMVPSRNTSSCYWRLEDADRLYREFAAAGLPAEADLNQPADEPWGMREFTLKDPAGNLIRAGHELRRDEPVE